jgi:hypothetical protein
MLLHPYPQQFPFVLKIPSVLTEMKTPGHKTKCSGWQKFIYVEKPWLAKALVDLLYATYSAEDGHL